MSGRVGVCSWSLRPGSPAELVERVRASGVDCVQLALDPLRTGAWSLDGTRAALAGAGVEIRSGMLGTRGEDYSTLESIRRTGGFRPDEHWDENRAAVAANAGLARELGLDLVSFHAGFLPEERGSREREVLLGRLRTVADLLAAEGVRAALETGQETAATLAGFLDELERPDVGVNFDPANMILYGMGDPVEALGALLPRVYQVHVKDARRAVESGTWGTEVPAGDGEVDWDAFFACLAQAGRPVDLMVEREAGSERIDDVRRAADLARRNGA